jgi:hypothetical protein
MTASINPNIRTQTNTTKNAALNLENLSARYKTTDGREKDLFHQDFKLNSGTKPEIIAKLEKEGCNKALAEDAFQMAIAYQNYKDLEPKSIGFNVVHVNNQAAVVVSGKPISPSAYKQEVKMASAVGEPNPQSDIHFFITKDGHLHEREAYPGPHRPAKS